MIMYYVISSAKKRISHKNPTQKGHNAMNGYNRPPQQNGNRTYGQAPQRRAPQNSKSKKKIYFKPNKEGMIALLTLVLIVALVITLLVLMIKGIVNAVSGSEETTTEATSTPEETTAPPIINGWYRDYPMIETALASEVSEGHLILVNFKNSYPNTDNINKELKSLYGSDGHNKLFVLNNSSVKIHRDIVNPLKNMLTALIADNPETLTDEIVIIYSGHRTVDYQTDLYDRSIGTDQEGYVAIPGHSEHHTGLAVDLKIFNENNMMILMRDNEQEWMEAHCAEYGFIVRYDDDKADITGILDESWHYRYVGIPHATYMMQNDLCLEEYLDLIRTSHSCDSAEPLKFSVGEDDYLVYYVPKTENDTVTEIRVPAATVGEYTVSGDNMNGFIVTVKLARSTSAE